MLTKSHKVGIVVDQNFGERIAELARDFHVWVVDSPTNTPVIRRFYELDQSAPEADPLDYGITGFEASETETAQEMCAEIAETVDIHHCGGFGDEPGWSEIVVYGVSLDERLRQVFEDIGATEISPTAEGFICRCSR